MCHVYFPPASRRAYKQDRSTHVSSSTLTNRGKDGFIRWAFYVTSGHIDLYTTNVHRRLTDWPTGHLNSNCLHNLVIKKIMNQGQLKKRDELANRNVFWACFHLYLYIAQTELVFWEYKRFGPSFHCVHMHSPTSHPHSHFTFTKHSMCASIYP